MMIEGPTGIGAVHLMEANDNDEAANHYNVTIAESPVDRRPRSPTAGAGSPPSHPPWPPPFTRRRRQGGDVSPSIR